MKSLTLAALFAALVATSAVHAADVPEMPKPTKEHEWLKQFVGEWESEGEAVAEPGKEAIKCKGSIKTRMLGEFWMVSEAKSEMMGASVSAVQQIGYDSTTKKYVGTWIDSMLNHLWRYEGSVDSTGKILTLEAEGPNFMDPGKTAKFRDTYEFKSKDHIVSTAAMQGPDGKWITFMNGNMRRKK